MTTKLKIEHRGRFKPDTLTLIGSLVASCGIIERCLYNGLYWIKKRERPFEAPIPDAFARRNKLWLDQIQKLRGADSPHGRVAADLYRKTANLFEIRHSIVHSVWLGQDDAGILHLNQVRDRKEGSLVRELFYPMSDLLRVASVANDLHEKHMEFLHRDIMCLELDDAGKLIRPDFSEII